MSPIARLVAWWSFAVVTGALLGAGALTIWFWEPCWGLAIFALSPAGGGLAALATWAAADFAILPAYRAWSNLIAWIAGPALDRPVTDDAVLLEAMRRTDGSVAAPDGEGADKRQMPEEDVHPAIGRANYWVLLGLAWTTIGALVLSGGDVAVGGIGALAGVGVGLVLAVARTWLARRG